MAGLLDDLPVATSAPQPAPLPPAPKSLLDDLPIAPTYEPKPAEGAIESIKAGFQGSAPGLAWRGKLPELVMDPQHSKWWERALTGITQVATELPLMAVGGGAGGAAGTAAGGALTGPAAPAGAIVGGILGTGAGMFALPGAIRESLIQAYKSGEIKTGADWWNILREVATTTAKEAGIGAVTFGAGSVAAKVAGKALLPAIGESITVGTGIKAIGTADVAGQIAAMVTMPAALQGRLPDAQEFLDAAIVIGGLKLAHPMANRITNVFLRTGRTPAQQVADAQADPAIADELIRAANQEATGTTSGVPLKLDRLVAEAQFLARGGVPEAPNIKAIIKEIKEAGPLQGDMVRDLDRLDTLSGRQDLNPAEKAEFDALTEKFRAQAEAAAEEVPRGTIPPAPPPAPRFAPEQLTEAAERARTRLEELTEKATREALTDAERAERIGLTNALGNPEALAKRFGIEPAIKPITDADRQASAQRVYDDVLRQAQENNAARQAAGLEPLGDEHALAVATLMRARILARATRLGVLPEDLYNERPLQIRDETQSGAAAAAAVIPPEAPRFVPPPEVDLFGNPVLPTDAPRVAGEAIPIVAIPLEQLKISKDVPQFKAGANARGVVQPLQGEVDLRGVAPIAVWERLNGDLEVISGRHRWDLWERKGLKTIDAQIFKESEGFDVRQATMLDAEMNIRDEHGSVSDYANYFKNSGISEETAKSRGLLGRAKGQAGFRIAHDAVPDLLAAHRAGLLSDDAALVISSTAPGSERLQALGMAMVNEGKSTLFAANMMRTIDLMAAERQAAGAQGDIFGFDDSAMREAASMAKKASSAQRKISEQISAVSGASRRPEIARKLGVDVQDPEGVQKKIAELKQEQYQWDNWPLYPELVAKLRAGDTLKQSPTLKPEIEDTPEAKRYVAELRARIRAGEDLGPILVDKTNPTHIVDGNHRLAAYRDEGIQPEVVPVDRMQTIQAMGTDPTLTPRMIAERTAAEARAAFELKPETPAELKARDAEAVAAAKRKLAQERVGVKGPVPTVDQADLFNTQRTLFQDKDKPWYYSELARSIESSPMKQGTAKAWQDYIKSRVGKGVKNEEIETTGINDWLATQEGKVTKEQVQAFMEQGGVKVTETVLGGPRKEGRGLSGEEADRFDALMIKPGELTDAEQREVDALVAKAEAVIEPPPTKFDDPNYQFPGSVPGSYRELVLTLPTREAGYDSLDGIAKSMFGVEYDRLNDRDRAKVQSELFNPKQNEFSSNHFPDAGNYLAHTRVNDRILPDGRKVLFVEEIQSDRAQKGRTEGFKYPYKAEDIERLPDTSPEAQAPDRFWYFKVPGNVLQIPKALYKTEADAIRHILTKPNGGAIAPAPFVTKTDSWTALVLKRLLRYAAEGDYDAIAWTRGEQQVERYTSALRKAVDVIEWKKTPEGVQIVGYKGRDFAESARLRELERRIDERGLNDAENAEYAQLRREFQGQRNKVVDTTEKESALSDAIGKSMADKIRNDPNQSGTIEGENITVSDTGMAGYYDRIVPKVAQEVAKKVGGGKVVEIKLEGRAESPSGMPNTWVPTVEKQQGLEITPAMREKIMAGQQLFQKPGQERDGQHLGSYSVAENLITTFRNANKSTIIHELSHSWLEEMKADAARPDAPAQIKADWELIRREFAIGENGEISTASHEQFARTGERYLGEGKAPSIGLRAVFERFKTWMLEIYSNLQNLGVNINPEIRGLFDRMLATDQEIADARAMDVPRVYVPEARAAAVEKMIQPEQPTRKIEPGFKAEQITMEPYADELPKGPGEAPDNSHINYATINAPRDVQLLMDAMARIDQENIQKQRGGTQGVKSWAEANAEQAKYVNDILGGSEDTLRILSPRDPDAAGPDVKLGILKKLAVGAAKDSARLRDIVLAAGHDATVRQQLEYMGSIERARMIQAEFLGERAGIARALNALKDVTDGTGELTRMLDVIGYGEAAARELFQAARTPAEEQAYMRLKLDEILQNYKGRTVLDIAKLHKEIGTLKGTFKFSKEVTKATKWEMVVEGWKASLLSGPVTHTTNLFGTEGFHFLRPAVDVLAATIGMARGASPGMGESDRASMSEAVARLGGMISGVKDGVKVAVATFKLDDPTGKTEAYRTAIPGRAGELIRIPLRLMGAEDALVTTMYKRGELATLAIRQAFDEQMNPSTREFAERVSYLKDHPTPEMEAAADAAATRMTFNAPLGEKGVALQLFVNKWNLQWMIPFIRTPINITKEVARMSPLAPLVGEWRAAIAKGGVERDRALAELAIGTGIMALAMAMTFDETLSGAGSPDPGKNRGKVGVWQPYSRLIGDTWYEYARIQPVGTLVGMAADVATIWDHMNDEEKDKIPKLLAVAFSNAVTNQTFLQGITNVINAMSEPTRFLPRFANQMAGSMVPNIIAQPTAMADPVVREVNGMLEAIQARIPGMRQDLLPKLDWLGEPVQSKERVGVVMPVRTQKISEDKVRLEAARLEISLAAAPKKTHIGKGTGKLGDVELTPEERNTFAKVGGEFAHQILDNIVNAPGYENIPDLVKRKIFRDVITKSHQLAAAAALPIDKRLAYIQSITERVTAELQPSEAQ